MQIRLYMTNLHGALLGMIDRPRHLETDRDLRLLQDPEQVLAPLAGLVVIDEVSADRWQRLWLRGGFPRSFTAKSDASSMEWRRAFVQTYLERDVLDVGLRMPPAELRRFWQMLAH
jgi:predicted AAA+ superfamily ATPase